MNGTTSPSSYPFYSGTDFTFLADFSRNDTTAIKNVSIKVLNSDGTVRTLPAVFDGKQNKWVATTKIFKQQPTAEECGGGVSKCSSRFS